MQHLAPSRNVGNAADKIVAESRNVGGDAIQRLPGVRGIIEAKPTNLELKRTRRRSVLSATPCNDGVDGESSHFSARQNVLPGRSDPKRTIRVEAQSSGVHNATFPRDIVVRRYTEQ